MFELQAATRPMSASPWLRRAVDNPLEGFLREGERRVIVHCQNLLRDPNLRIEDQRRLERLLAAAEVRLRELAATQN